MIHKITDNYRTWLKRYSEQRDCLHKDAAKALWRHLDLIESIDNLQGLLRRYPRPQRDPAFFIDPYIDKFDELVRTVDQLVGVNISSICHGLDTISTDEKTVHVIALIKDVLTHRQCLLHANISSLLRLVDNGSELQNILNHLSDQPQRERPSEPRPGSFDAITARNETHQACLDLLRTNAGKNFRDSDRNRTGANILLQTLLSIYEDINTTREEPNHSAASTLQEEHHSCCSIS